MWERAELKRRAKLILKHRLWDLVIATILLGILSGSFLSGVTSMLANTYNLGAISMDELTFGLLMLGVSLVTILVITVLSCLFQTGGTRFFMRVRQGHGEIGDLFFSFRSGRTGHIFVTNLLVGIFVYLWSLLLFIPGIIKAYEYYMIPYILSENPNLPRKRVFEISKLMTQGEKMSIFILGLSFLGWSLLCLLTLGIGYFVLQPYMYATYAELYAALRDKVLYQGVVTPQELPGFAEPQDSMLPPVM